MEVDVINFLVGNPAIILQDIIVCRACSVHELLDDGQDLCELIIWNIGQLFAVKLWNHQGVALAKWLNVEESEDFVALEELERRNITFDNLAENTSSHFALFVYRAAPLKLLRRGEVR